MIWGHLGPWPISIVTAGPSLSGGWKSNLSASPHSLLCNGPHAHKTQAGVSLKCTDLSKGTTAFHVCSHLRGNNPGQARPIYEAFWSPLKTRGVACQGGLSAHLMITNWGWSELRPALKNPTGPCQTLSMGGLVRSIVSACVCLSSSSLGGGTQRQSPSVYAV